MTFLLMLIYIISFLITIFIFMPIGLYFIYELSSLYSKLYLRLMGSGKKSYQYLLVFPLLLISFVTYRRYLSKNSQQGRLDNHVAIVLANNYFPENIYSFGIDGVKRIVKYLKKRKIPYRVYDRVTSNQLKKIINNKNISSIILFGHGQRHGIKVGKDETLYYCEFQNPPKRHLVAQFHCNHLKGKSLADYGDKPKFVFIKNKLQNNFDIEGQVKKIIKDKILEEIDR